MIMALGYITLSVIILAVLFILWVLFKQAHRSLFWAVYERKMAKQNLGVEVSLWKIFAFQFTADYESVSSPAFGEHPWAAPKWFPLGDYEYVYEDDEDDADRD